MKRIFCLLLLSVWLTAVAEEAKVKVTGGRVNIRSRASLSGELMGQVMLNDELVLTGKTHGEFVAVYAPDWVESWVAKEYIQDGIVVPPKLNVRAGPNMNYGVVAVVTRGDKLEVTQELNDWLKIKAPTNAVAWISSKFIAPVSEEKPQPATPEAATAQPAAEAVANKAAAEAEPEVKPEPKEEVQDMASAYDAMVAEIEPIIQAMPVEPKLGPPVPIVFEIDHEREQGGAFSAAGTLQPSRSIYIFRLVGADGRTKCFIRGNKDQMRRLVGAPLRVEGKQYFYKRMELPVVKPSKLVKLRG
ncbi:SH3 domain-containing protein [Verrucomicrobiota bacterium]